MPQQGDQQGRETKFIVDAMLGNVAKWLRILGYDTLYSKAYNDAQILAIAQRTSRLIVTNDRGLNARALKRGLMSLLVEEGDVARVLAQLASRGLISLDVDPSRSRCPICNGRLVLVTDKNLVRGRVPPGALAKHNKFYMCARCGHVYWEGGHWVNIRKLADRARMLMAQEFSSTRAVQGPAAPG